MYVYLLGGGRHTAKLPKQSRTFDWAYVCKHTYVCAVKCIFIHTHIDSLTPVGWADPMAAQGEPQHYWKLLLLRWTVKGQDTREKRRERGEAHRLGGGRPAENKQWTTASAAAATAAANDMLTPSSSRLSVPKPHAVIKKCFCAMACTVGRVNWKGGTRPNTHKSEQSEQLEWHTQCKQLFNLYIFVHINT